jgi:hypothetical protein
MTLRLQTGGPVFEYTGLSTDPSGIFTVTADVPNGSYYWRVKGPKYLANSGSVLLTRGAENNAEMGLMHAGDCNNDNSVSVTDFIVLRGTFGSTLGEPNYDARADFNGDDRVTVVDLTLLNDNFGAPGAPPLGPTGP